MGSYTLNGWAFPDPGIYPHPDPNWEPGYDPWRPESFRSESEIGRPALTPSSGDGTGFLDGPLGVMPAPTECDLPPTDINDPYAATTWAWRGFFGIGSFAIPRHGSRPSTASVPWPQDQPLPGAVNLSFFAGHVELVKLDRLWQLYWHKDYQPPAKRPGLK